MYTYTRTQYPRYTRTYKQYTHVYWVQEKNLKEFISTVYVVKKTNVFALSWKKIFLLSDCEKKFSGFLSEENKNKNLKKKRPPGAPPPPRPENQMVGP